MGFQASAVLRLLDFVLAFAGLIATAPILLLFCVVGWFDTGAPLLFQQRIGYKKRVFVLVKFRTMHTSTPWLATHQVSPRAVTRWGAFLRKNKLDELPQLWNVIKGEMSLVGPRPCLPNQYDLIAVRDRLGVFNVRPGITGLAQIKGIDMSTPELLAKTDAQMIARFGIRDYFRYLFLTLLGHGRGDRLLL